MKKSTNKVNVESARAIGIRALVSNSPTINGIHYVSVPLDYLEVHPTVQRPLRDHYKKIAEEWDYSKCGTLLVSYRGGHLYIIDGQHRKMAAKIKGLPSVPCAIREGLTEQQEALLFGRQDENKVKLKSHEKVNALIIGGDQTALTLQKACRDYNISIRPTTTAPYMRCLYVAMNSIRSSGDTELRWAFETIKNARWSDVKMAYGRVMIIALLNTYRKYKDGNSRLAMMCIANTIRDQTFEQVSAEAQKFAGINKDAATAMAAYFEDVIENTLKRSGRITEITDAEIAG